MQAMTTRGVKSIDTQKIIDFIDRAFIHREDKRYISSLHQEVIEFCKQFPVPAL